jgi:hypothetical protein
MKRNTKILLRVIVIVLAITIFIGVYLSNNIQAGIINDNNATYNKCQYNICYANNSQWNLMCVDSQNKLQNTGQFCSGGCVNSACTNLQIAQQGCVFAQCNSDVTTVCADKTLIISYKCINNCAVPTNNVCKNLDGVYPQNPISSDCKYYEVQNQDKSCAFSFNEAISSLGVNQLWQEKNIMITLILDIIIVVIIFFITR